MTAEPAPEAGGAGSRRAPAGPADRTEFWRRSLRGWDVAFYTMTAISAGSIATGRPSTGTAVVAYGALAALVLAYTVLGRRAARTGDARRAGWYLGVLVAVVVVVVSAHQLGTVLLFIAYSQIWFFSTTRRRGVVLCVVLTAGTTAALAVGVRQDAGQLLDMAGQMTIALFFAIALGLWITQMAEQSEERAELIERLEAAQAQIAAQHHAAGVAAERERFAQDIHDTLAQGFTSVVMLAQTAVADLDRGDPGAARGRVQLIETTARENLAEARALVGAFVPVPLEDATLGQALSRLADRFRAETGVLVDVDADAPCGSLPRDVEVVLLRAAQEALANVRRHASATRVRLRLAVGAGTAELEVLDDGRGIPVGTPEGIGLGGMRDRVAARGGELQVDAEAAGGTRLRVRVPAAPPVTGRGAGA